MEMDITHVGLDAHAKLIQAGTLAPGREMPVVVDVPNEKRALGRFARKLLRESGGRVLCCYEAGPCGYALQRQLKDLGVDCIVVAPSLIPVKPGERVKTDARDARKLAKLLRAGLLTEVHPPTAADESIRDLCRSREDAKRDQNRHRHQLQKFVVRQGLAFAGKRAWTVKYNRWLRSLTFENPAHQEVLDDYLVTLEYCDERLKRLDARIDETANLEPYREPVAWLRCLHGVDTVAALTLVAELHDFRRFKSARELMAYLGVVASEHSSGEKQRRGGITKAGNGHVRRMLIESAWHYRHRPLVGSTVKARRAGQPAWAVAIASKAQERLSRRYHHMLMRGKHHNVVATAVARELVGFIWALLQGNPRSHVGTGAEPDPKSSVG